MALGYPVGLGSICRRQGTVRIATLTAWFADYGIRLHGFGVKTDGLALCGDYLVSSDSCSWSYDARRNDPLHACAHGSDGNGTCANCLRWARRSRLTIPGVHDGDMGRLASWQRKEVADLYDQGDLTVPEIAHDAGCSERSVYRTVTPSRTAGRKPGPAEVRARIITDRASGASWRQIASALNAEGVPTSQGGKWWAATCKLVAERSAA